MAGFVNFSAVCEQLVRDTRPIHLICAGTDDAVTLEDTLLAGAFVECFSDEPMNFNDSARLAWDCFEHHGTIVAEALRLSQGGEHLIKLGYEKDIDAAAQVDRFMLVPEMKHQPHRLEVGCFGMVKKRWPRR